MEYEGFRLHPDWEPIADQQDPLRMANVLYTDLKKNMYQGIIPPKEAVTEMINVIKFILERDFYWSRDQLDEFEQNFLQLNQYYSPEEKMKEMVDYNRNNIQNSRLPKELKDILSQLSDVGGDIQITTSGPDGHIISNRPMYFSPPLRKTGHGAETSKRHRNKTIYTLKTLFYVFFKATVYWLALFGLLTLLGL